MYSITVVTPNATLPVSVADLHAHLKNNDTTEDALLTLWIQAASDLYTMDTNEVLMTTDYQLWLDGFPNQQRHAYHNSPPQPVIYVPLYPVTAIASVEYLDPTAAWQTLDNTSLDLNHSPARVILPSNLPVLHASQLPAVRVNFTAGYANAASIPSLPVTLVKLIAAHWYEQRNAYTETNLKDIPAGFKAICGYRRLNYIGDWNKGASNERW